jgi:hypothetical protein
VSHRHTEEGVAERKTASQRGYRHREAQNPTVYENVSHRHTQREVCVYMCGSVYVGSGDAVWALGQWPGTHSLVWLRSLQKEKVAVGDVIYIEANSGAVKVAAPHPPQRERGREMPTYKQTHNT